MKFVFVDCEYTSTHAKTTLVSIGLVTYGGKELYLTLNDYDKDQLSDWVKENVIIYIDESKSISTKQAVKEISNFLEEYSEGEKVSIVSAGKSVDVTLLFQMWHSLHPELKYFSFERYLPTYLRHRSHFDLDTIFFCKGLDPDAINRESFAGEIKNIKKHDALYDANVVRKCFIKLQQEEIASQGAMKLV